MYVCMFVCLSLDIYRGFEHASIHTSMHTYIHDNSRRTYIHPSIHTYMTIRYVHAYIHTYLTIRLSLGLELQNAQFLWWSAISVYSPTRRSKKRPQTVSRSRFSWRFWQGLVLRFSRSLPPSVHKLYIYISNAPKQFTIRTPW